MAIPVFFGVRSYGRVNQRDGSYVATRFFHLWLLPIIPVGGARGAHGYDQEEKAPISVLSLFLGYFKVWGFIATLVALFSVSVIISKSSDAFVLWPLVLVVLFGMGIVVSTWFWVGADPRSSAGRRIGGTLAVLAPFALLSGFALYSGYSDKAKADARETQQSQLSAAAAQQQQQNAKAGIQAALDQHAAAPLDKLARCTDERLDPISTSSAIYVEVVEAGYLRAASTGANVDAARASEWLVSKKLRLEPSESQYGEYILGELTRNQLLAVISLDESQPPPRGASRLAGKVTFHEMPTGRGICGTAITAPSKPSKTPESTLRADFVEAASKAAAAMTPRIKLQLEAPAAAPR